MSERSTESGAISVGRRLADRLTGPNTYGNGGAFWLAFAAVVGLLALYPSFTNLYQLGLVSRYMALAFLALSLCFVWGYCGVLSFGQVAFFGVAGYAFGVVAVNAAANALPVDVATTTGLTLAIPVAVLLGTAFSAALGYFMFYGGVRDVYVTIITLVVALVLNTFMAQTAGSEWAVGEAQLGGFNGMPGIPDMALGVGGAGITLEYETLYYAILASLVITYLGLRVLVNSSFGMTMVAIREDEDRTETFGYDVAFVKLVAFTIGGALASLGGVFYVGVDNYVDPSVFAISFAALPVVWVSVGGRESLLGAIGATLAIERLRNELTSGIGGVVDPEWAMVIVGTALLFVILAMPAGVAPYAQRAGERLFGQLPDRSSGDRAEETVE